MRTTDKLRAMADASEAASAPAYGGKWAAFAYDDTRDETHVRTSGGVLIARCGYAEGEHIAHHDPRTTARFAKAARALAEFVEWAGSQSRTHTHHSCPGLRRAGPCTCNPANAKLDQLLALAAAVVEEAK
jgi:hypothetical protein